MDSCRRLLLAGVAIGVLTGGVGCSSDDSMAEGAARWTVGSPDGRLELQLAMMDLSGTADYPVGDRLYYRAELGGSEVMRWSPLGIVTDRSDFAGALSFREQSLQTTLSRYSVPIGKRRVRNVGSNQITLRFANAAADEIDVIFRVADDGFGFRYRIAGEGVAVAHGEVSGFRPVEGAIGWLAPYSNPSPFSPAYERFYERHRVGESNRDNGWGYAALFRAPGEDLYTLISEADLDRTYAGTHLSQPIESVYRVAYPAQGEGRGVGAVLPTAPLPWTTPWRVVVVGDLPAVFASTLVDDFSRPLADVFSGDSRWVNPGRSAWSWFSQDTGSPELQRRYIDTAADLGWEYVLVDARWDQWPRGEEDLLDVLEYADDAGVGVLLWYNSGGDHNILASETPRDRMSDPDIRRAELSRIAGLGVRGIKIDFFQSEKQDRIQQYLDILEDAAAERLLVNFHGCTLPRGWQRTYPNLVTMEAVRGAETYRLFDGPDAIDNVRLALTRNVVGSMDYTPVTFRDALDKRSIPYAHQIALAVVFESGVQHFADRADGDPEEGFAPVFAQAPFVEQFFSAVPTAWDESVLLDGAPDSHVVVARRDADTWYIGAINGLEEPLSRTVRLPPLGSGTHTMSVIRSGDSPDRLSLDVIDVVEGGILEIALAAKDGLVAIVAPGS